MTETQARMRERPAAQALIEPVLALQATGRERSRLAQVLGVNPLSPDATAWYTGAIGEQIVGSLLASLPPEWFVFHSVPVGRGEADVDHLLVGPGGVFTINTKHHAGKDVWVRHRALWVNGQSTHHIANAEGEARHVEKLLERAEFHEVAVTPMVVLVNPKSIQVKQHPDRVVVLNARQLVRYISKRRGVLTPGEIASLVDLFDSPTSWRTLALTEADAYERFRALGQEVKTAAERRAMWAVGIAVVALAVCLPQVIGALT